MNNVWKEFSYLEMNKYLYVLRNLWTLHLGVLVLSIYLSIYLYMYLSIFLLKCVKLSPLIILYCDWLQIQ